MDIEPNLEDTLKDITNHEETKQRYNEQIISNLKKCYDPEISVDIFSLGLIYDFKVTEDKTIWVLMSLTSTFCPEADLIVSNVKFQMESIEDIKECNVRVTMVPQWGKNLINPEVVALMGW